MRLIGGGLFASGGIFPARLADRCLRSEQMGDHGSRWLTNDGTRYRIDHSDTFQSP